MRLSFLAVPVLVATGLAGPARAEIATFYFAPQGNSYSAFLPPDDPLVGQRAVLARIYLTVESFPGSDAADFFTDISFPIFPDAGATNALVLSGADLGWSGEGVFTYFIETTALNGEFVPARYGAETFSETFRGAILDGSRIEFEVVPAPGTITALIGGGAIALRRRRP